MSRQAAEDHQVVIYVLAVVIAAALSLLVPATRHLEGYINPALALMLFATFLQVPIAEIGRLATHVTFLAPLLLANFVAIPLLVAVLIQWLPTETMLRLGVLLVLLTPCIDYVVTFARLGRSDAARLLASTPILLIVQILALPFYLRLFLGDTASEVMRVEPFLLTFLWLIVAPLACAGLLQLWAARRPFGRRLADRLGALPVPATALVLFVVIAALMPRLGDALNAALTALPVYVAFAILAPGVGWLTARLFRLSAPAARAVAFSAGTRNSLVVLPLALAVPGGMPVLPAIIVTQTMVELVSELIYVRVLGRLGAGAPTARSGQD